jgi:hypothetical protein
MQQPAKGKKPGHRKRSEVWSQEDKKERTDSGHSLELSNLLLVHDEVVVVGRATSRQTQENQPTERRESISTTELQRLCVRLARPPCPELWRTGDFGCLGGNGGMMSGRERASMRQRRTLTGV